MSFADMMAELRREYISDLPKKIQEIRTRLTPVQSEALREDFHKLKGTGSTYGVPEISSLAEVVEKICETQPQVISAAVPKAVELLQEIHASRRQEQAFDIQADQRFSDLKKLAA